MIHKCRLNYNREIFVMTEDFDLVILGVGMAGVTAASKCASAGWEVAVIDELPCGGTCALRRGQRDRSRRK